MLGDPINVAAGVGDSEGGQVLAMMHSTVRPGLKVPPKGGLCQGKSKARVFQAIAPIFSLSTWRTTDGCIVDSCQGGGS